MNVIELNRALRQLRLGGMAAELETRLHQAQTEPMPPLTINTNPSTINNRCAGTRAENVQVFADGEVLRIGRRGSNDDGVARSGQRDGTPNSLAGGGRRCAVSLPLNRIFEVAQKKESLASAFRKLTARNLSLIPVVEDQILVGILTLQNLMHSMALLAESRKLRKATVDS